MKSSTGSAIDVTNRKPPRIDTSHRRTKKSAEKGRSDYFAYDALGNRTGQNSLASRGSMTFTRDDNGLNQYKSWMPFSVINYDDDIGGTWGSPQHANGVIMQEGNVTAGFNALNQPMQVTSAATAPDWMFFGYDPLGRCVKRWIGALTADGKVPPIGSNPATYFYYDGWNLVQKGSSVTSPSRFYVHGARVDEIVKQITMPNKWERYFHYEGRGHCAFQTDVLGNIVEQYEYDAFGQPYFYNAAGTNIGSSGWGNRFLFTGREYVSELKLYDFRNRLYQPELGRFLQPDPKHFAAGDYNLYRYCHNDPVNKSDPTGLDLILLWQTTTAGLQGHTATLSGNDHDGWHFFEKQGGEGQTSGNVHLEFKTAEAFRSSGRGDGYSNASRVSTSDKQDKEMADYGKTNYNTPYHVEGDNCADLSAGIAEKAGMHPSREKVPFTNITRPNTLAGEVAKHGTDARSQIHSDQQQQRDKRDAEKWRTGPRY